MNQQGQLSQFEVTAAGFDGNTDETDDRVIWVLAPSLEYLLQSVGDLDVQVFALSQEVPAQDLDFLLPAQIANFTARCQYFKNLTDSSMVCMPDQKPE